MNLIALTNDLLQSHRRECVRRVEIIKLFYSPSVIEETHKNGIDEVGEEDEFDVQKIELVEMV